ncbi:3-deoxy-manno-octulosonate cytidylyltransferase [Psychrosphaera sp.]|nr:3-deoxy-manno-octulosonate cytidylyltransferase [Psychrosphaera sp.]
MSNLTTHDFIVVIPARYDSTRLPGKPLAIIDDKPMVQWVYERGIASGASKVIVATDDQRVFDAVKDFGGEVCMTAKSHESGTERLAEVLEIYGFADDTVVVNVQGDEPMIPSVNIQQLAGNLLKLKNQNVGMATLSESICSYNELTNPNVVKVVTNKDGLALTFSRSALPYDREQFTKPADNINLTFPYQRHIGIYAYTAGFIKDYISWPTSELEQIESLEQLRVLWQGKNIHVDLAIEPPPAGVDTPEDLEQVRRLVASLKQQ